MFTAIFGGNRRPWIEISLLLHKQTLFMEKDIVIIFYLIQTLVIFTFLSFTT